MATLFRLLRLDRSIVVTGVSWGSLKYYVGHRILAAQRPGYHAEVHLARADRPYGMAAQAEPQNWIPYGAVQDIVGLQLATPLRFVSLLHRVSGLLERVECWWTLPYLADAMAAHSAPAQLSLSEGCGHRGELHDISQPGRVSQAMQHDGGAVFGMMACGSPDVTPFPGAEGAAFDESGRAVQPYRTADTQLAGSEVMMVFAAQQLDQDDMYSLFCLVRACAWMRLQNASANVAVYVDDDKLLSRLLKRLSVLELVLESTGYLRRYASAREAVTRLRYRIEVALHTTDSIRKTHAA